METNKELSRIGRRGMPQAGRHLGALRSPGQKVNQRLQPKVKGEEYVYILTTPPYQNASGLHSNCSSKSASETAGISREEALVCVVVVVGVCHGILGSWRHHSHTWLPTCGVFKAPNIRSNSVEAAGAGFFWVPIQSPEVFGLL